MNPPFWLVGDISKSITIFSFKNANRKLCSTQISQISSHQKTGQLAATPAFYWRKRGPDGRQPTLLPAKMVEAEYGQSQRLSHHKIGTV